MKYCDILKLDLPNLFPVQPFEEFIAIVRNVTERESDARREFNGASNLIGWRFRACIESKEEYFLSWKQFGVGVSFEEIYRREKLLFETFVSGLSCIESATYACYALASDHNILNLPFDERVRRYRSSPKHFLDKLRAVTPVPSLVEILDTIISSDEWDLWTGYRNTMTHRSNIPRIIYGSGGAPLPPANALEFAATWSSRALSGNEEIFNSIIFWLAKELENLLRGGISLAHGN